jgi:O-acetyl-ADP-ribose deacetylase (regulator of RNase III)
MEQRVKNLLKKYGLSGVNKAKETPSHPKKSHIVLAKVGDKVRLIRFGQKGADTVTESNPSPARAAKRASFKARHAKNIAKGKMSAAFWADKIKW